MAFRKKGQNEWQGSGAKTMNRSMPKVEKIEAGGADLVSGTKQQEAIWKELVDGKKHIIVKALAGTGKTFTVIQGLKRLAGKMPGRVAFIAFNTSIAKELQTKVPSWVQACTCHSLLWRALLGEVGRLELNEDKTLRIIEDLVGGESEYLDLRRRSPEVISQTKKLVGLCKGTLTGFDLDNRKWVGAESDEIEEIAVKYGVELNGSAQQVIELTQRALNASSDLDYCHREADFDDQIWLPIVLDIRLPKFDLLCVDESQDLNACQQEAIWQMGSRVMLVGDENQAIYGFRGADADAIQNMQDLLESDEIGVKVLPLTYTRRCPKYHVRLAQEIVPQFAAMPEAPQGSVQQMEEAKAEAGLGPGDMVICRTNAPVVGMAFRLIRNNVKANIQGRDIGKGLIGLINKLSRNNEKELTSVVLERLEQYEIRELDRLNKKKNPSMAAIEAIQDKCRCVEAICQGTDTVYDAARKIEAMFLDVINNGEERNFVLLSSVHRAKGLEAKKVVILDYDRMPHPMAKTVAEKRQEWNVKYVAITRSKDVLVLCPTPQWRKTGQAEG